MLHTSLYHLKRWDSPLKPSPGCGVYAAVHLDLRCLLYAGSDKWANSTHLQPGPLHFNVLTLAQSLVSEQLLLSIPIARIHLIPLYKHVLGCFSPCARAQAKQAIIFPSMVVQGRPRY